MPITVQQRPFYRGPVAMVQQLLSTHLRPGDRVVDATCGNGKDTLFLARLIAPHGELHAFDIQPEAIERTEALLTQHQLLDGVTCYVASHENMASYVKAPCQAIVFNLGWLPGGDHTITTCSDSTIRALLVARDLLAPGGLLMITCYPGHPGGEQEALAVNTACAAFDPRYFFVWKLSQNNVAPNAPYTIAIQRSPTP